MRWFAIVAAVGASLTLGVFHVSADARSAHLEFADAPRMLDCEPASSIPCFRAKLNMVDAGGAPAPVELPSPDALAKSVTVLLDGQSISPFYVQAEGANTARRSRLALILVDVSGSMNQRLATGQTRFEAAKSALMVFLDAFQDGVDSVAIVPFESHGVEPTIRGAQFTSSKDQARNQVSALPFPAAHNNTGLYTAVRSGLETLSHRASALDSTHRSPEVLLIVMTDGKNEVLRGDDNGLLDGPAALDSVSQTVHDSGMQVMAVGFGDLSKIDEPALRSLSTKLYMASDAESLKRAFSIARTLLNSRITVTFNSPRWPDRASLAGRTLHISARISLPSGQALAPGESIWAAPQLGTPIFAGKCTSEERRAQFAKINVPAVDWTSIVRPVLVFAGLSLLLVALWFWVPRLIWPDRYSGMKEELERWRNTQATVSGKGRAPRGFTSPGHQGPGDTRTPGDQTWVQPRTDFSKTRLGRDF